VSAAVSSLSGQFFLTVDTDGIVKWQGEILGQLELGYFKCQLYGCMGQPNGYIVRHLSEMVQWRFYSNEDDWHSAYYKAISR